jgi:hypothetical protein
MRRNLRAASRRGSLVIAMAGLDPAIHEIP